MKRKTAKEILAESFRELAEQKPVDKITVKEITENCGYSSATFYRQFRDKYDLIAWEYSRQLEQIMSQLGGQEHTWLQTLSDGAHWFADRREYLSNLFLHTEGLDAFIFYMREINYTSLKNAVLRVSGLRELDAPTQMQIRVYVLGTVQITCEWVLGKYPVDAEALAAVYEAALPVSLRQYLTKK